MYDTCASPSAVRYGIGDETPYRLLLSTTEAFRWGTADVKVLAHPNTGVNPRPLSRAEVSVADMVTQSVRTGSIEKFFDMISA